MRRPSRPMCLLAVAVAVGVLAVPALSQAPQPKRGGVLRFAMDTDPPNIDPHVAPGAASRNVTAQLYNGLVKYGPNGALVADLAERWEVRSPQLYIFKLRRGIKFHNGEPFKAADVKASLERIADARTGASLRGPLGTNIDRVDVVDDYTVRVSLREPQATFLPLLARSEAVIVPASLVASGHDFRTRPVGTGPFKFAEREPNVRIRVVRNPDYFEKGIPYLDEIVFVPISDDGTRVNALRSGEVDMIGYAPWKDMTTIERDRRLQLWQQTGPFMCLMFNVNRRPFNDVRVRQAVAYAINRQDVVDIVFHKRGSIITGGIIPAGTWAHNGDFEGMYKYDPDRARRLLREAGYDPSTPIRLMASATHAIHYQTAEIVQAALRQVGMNVVLDLQDWPVAVQRGLRGDYDFRVHGLATIILDPDFYSVWFDGTSTFYARAVGYRDDTIDRLLAQGRALVGRDARKALYHQMEQRLLETVPWTFLSWRVQGDAGLRIIKGYQQLPGGLVSESLVNMRYVWLDK